MNIPIVRDVLAESNALAAENRLSFDKYGVFVLNMMSSPGAGKTTVLQQTIRALTQLGRRCAVIEGDITTTLDAERLIPLGIPVVQANTEPFGGDCHVGSHLVHAALKQLPLDALDYMFIENIGNLVCPAEFDLGEHRKVVVLSLPEGEDKPLKYPLMFRECRMCLLNKVDLQPYLDVDIPTVLRNISMVNGMLPVIPISARTGYGREAWVQWLESGREAQQQDYSLRQQAAG
ncbi:hydrogenase nickel incorporation protein HypB [candidate division KSB1 bacterium]|nr:hydrogenase nickel incorporation protein HypB [candidate division KSB1 bacterium]